MAVLLLIVLELFHPTWCKRVRDVDSGVGKIWSGDEFWARNLMHNHLLNMTAEIIKDTKNRLRHADNIQSEHRHSIGYDLGTISAGILERFILMLKLYRKYSSIPDLKTNKYSVTDFMNTLSVIQGAYNEITLEKAMFFDILKKYEDMDPDHVEQSRMNRLQSKKPSWFNPDREFVFRRAGVWRPAVNQFDV